MESCFNTSKDINIYHIDRWGCLDRGRMVAGYTTTYAISAITTNVVGSNTTHGEVYSHNIMW